MDKTIQPLKHLRDIHLPAPIAWWPPAPGWWILAGLILLLVGIIVFWFYRRFQAQAVKRLAIKKLTYIEENLSALSENKNILSDISVLMRRTALAYFPRKDVAGLHGSRWLEFLDQTIKTDAFSKGVGRVLLMGPYAQHVDKKQLAPLIQLVRDWLDRL